MINVTFIQFFACLKEVIVLVIVQPLATIIKCLLPIVFAQLKGPKALKWFVFYFYLFGTIFLLLESYAKTTRLPLTRGTYCPCHYYQVHLPEEAMALRNERMSYISKDILRHRRMNAIRFTVDKKPGNSKRKYRWRIDIAREPPFYFDTLPSHPIPIFMYLPG